MKKSKKEVLIAQRKLANKLVDDLLEISACANDLLEFSEKLHATVISSTSKELSIPEERVAHDSLTRMLDILYTMNEKLLDHTETVH